MEHLITPNTFCNNCNTIVNHSIAVVYCKACQANLCNACAASIHQLNLFKDHKKPNGTQQEEPITPSPHYCTAHADEKVKFWCTRCNCLVCCECLIGRHKGHPRETIDTVAQNTKSASDSA